MVWEGYTGGVSGGVVDVCIGSVLWCVKGMVVVVVIKGLERGKRKRKKRRFKTVHRKNKREKEQDCLLLKKVGERTGKS